MLIAALETERLGAYFLPSLGPAPRWCHFLDNITEEMEEAPAAQGMYDDYKFVTREELERLSLVGLIGTSSLKPYMHGFFIDERLHAKAVSLSQPFAYEQWRKEQHEKKREARTAGRIAPVAKPKVKVNADLADELRGPIKGRRGKGEDAGAAAAASNLLDDSRFASLFTDPAFAIDKESAEFSAVHPHAQEQAAARQRRALARGLEDSEDEDGGPRDGRTGGSAESEEEGEGTSDEESDEESEGRGSDGEGSDGELEQMKAQAAKRGRDGRAKPAVNPPPPQRQRQQHARNGSGDASGGAARGGSGSGGGGKMIGLPRDILRGSAGAVSSSVLPATATFGARLASVPDGDSATIGPSVSGRAVGNRELRFTATAPPPEPETGGKGGKGKGKGKGGKGKGKGSMGRGGGFSGGDRDERRGMERGMLGPGKGKGKGGKGKGKGRR